MFRSCVVASRMSKLAVKLRVQRALTTQKKIADPSHWGVWREKLVKFFTENPYLVLLGAGATGGSYIKLSGSVNDTVSTLIIATRDYVNELTHSLDKSVLKISEDPAYVTRADLEGILESAKSLPPEDSYYVIYGPKGAGKSKLTTHAAKDRTATIRVTVTSASKQEDILSILAMNLLGTVHPILNVDSFVLAVDNCKNTPLIVFDVERSETKDQRELVGAVRGVCKALAHKCICWIVLSEANAVLTFGKNFQREKFIYIDEMKKEEARKFLNSKLNPPVDGMLMASRSWIQPIKCLPRYYLSMTRISNMCTIFLAVIPLCSLILPRLERQKLPFRILLRYNLMRQNRTWWPLPTNQF
jgi:hypothetical protein